MRYISYSIPLVCGLALLLPAMSNIMFTRPSFAADCPFPEDEYDAPPKGYYWGGSECTFVPILTQPGTTTLTPTIAMTIDSGSSVSKQIQAEYNKANYSAHTVAVSASNISSYTLTLSNVSMIGPSALTGVSNVKGSALSNNTWGYGWDSTTTSNDNITYSSASSKSLGDTPVSNNSVSLSKKLVFATKFGEDASSGGYKVKATLSLVATPATVTDTYVHWDNMVYMQDMTADACSEATTSTPEKTLIDIRDDSTYTVKKLSDGKCWMTQNLRITGDSMKKIPNSSGLGDFTLSLSQYDSNVISSFTIPASAYYDNDTIYGAYYSWYAATANTSLSYGNATNDICPKGWRLPVGGFSSSEFQILYDKGQSNWTTNSNKNGYWIGAPNSNGGAFFPAAGSISSGSLSGTGSIGHYWSNYAQSSDYAHNLIITSDSIKPAVNQLKSSGYSVRCVAK